MMAIVADRDSFDSARVFRSVSTFFGVPGSGSANNPDLGSGSAIFKTLDPDQHEIDADTKP